MARLLGVDLPRDERMEIALTYIFGIGRTRALQALGATGISPDKRSKDISDEEVVALRAYLLKGGFLTVDDFWGTPAWEQWAEEIGRVLPPSQYPIIDIPRDHVIMHELYDVHEVEQVSSIQFWMRSGGSVSERARINDSPHVNFRGIADEKGRLMVVMTHNTDIPDTWEREGENQEYFDRFSPNGYAVGVNVVLYAMTH